MDGLGKRKHQGDRHVSPVLIFQLLSIRRLIYCCRTGITNQRETTLCWSRESGKSLCNAIVWDDARTNGVVRAFEQKLDEEGIDIDDEDEDEIEGLPETVEMGTGKKEAAFSDQGKAGVDGQSGVAGVVGKAMEGLGLAGRGKGMTGKQRRKGREGLVDV